MPTFSNLRTTLRSTYLFLQFCPYEPAGHGSLQCFPRNPGLQAQEPSAWLQRPWKQRHVRSHCPPHRRSSHWQRPVSCSQGEPRHAQWTSQARPYHPALQWQRPEARSHCESPLQAQASEHCGPQKPGRHVHTPVPWSQVP